MEHILVINPGSTSTKIAVYEGEMLLFKESISHSPEELEPYEHVAEQYGFRKQVVMSCLSEHGFDETHLDAVVSRGGLLGPIHAGAYLINDDMLWQLENRPLNEHPANVGAMIAHSIGKSLGIPALIYDGITVDELTPINRLTGLKEFRRKGLGHNLNTRAAALRYADETGKSYDEITVIVAHLGGGISVNLHHHGRIEDFISDEEGPFSPERAGGLPAFDLIRMCFEEGMTYDSMMKKVKRQGGLMSHLGTTDALHVEKMIGEGDEHAKLIYDSMALNIAKNIAKCAPSVSGRVDAIILTGGIAHSEYLTKKIEGFASFIAPVIVYPGENEMLSLAMGGLRVLRGLEKTREYVRVEDPAAVSMVETVDN